VQDGHYGPSTMRAVIAWQTLIWDGYAEEIDGVWGHYTRQRSAEFIADQASTPQPGPTRFEPSDQAISALAAGGHRWDTTQNSAVAMSPNTSTTQSTWNGTVAFDFTRPEPEVGLIPPVSDELVSAHSLRLLKAAQDVSDAEFWSWAVEKDRIRRVARTALQALVGGVAGFILTIVVPAATSGDWPTWDHIRIALLALVLVPVLTVVASGMQNLFNIGPAPTPPVPSAEPLPVEPPPPGEDV
jgi:hypothetical protein